MSIRAKILKRKRGFKKQTHLSTDRLRLSVFRSSRHIYVQLIDDNEGVTVASASTLDKSLAKDLKKGSDIKAAELVGNKIVEEAQKKLGKKELKIRFDRGPFLFHGRVKALAEAARRAGFIF